MTALQKASKKRLQSTGKYPVIILSCRDEMDSLRGMASLLFKLHYVGKVYSRSKGVPLRYVHAAIYLGGRSRTFFGL